MIKERFPNCETWGTDISDQVVADNIVEHPESKFFQQRIGNQDKLQDSYFDTVHSGEVLEHLDDPNTLLKDAYRILKPGGTLIISTPNSHMIESPEHVWYFEKEDVIKLFIDNGFTEPEFQNLPDMESLHIIFAVGKKI